ncbi:MAG TPA: SRPBCC domain-containing protein [Longimicrobiaceae bacterium]|nr:SRPBCC domain-containing protein [Longimicrobiaceae bacterium]
MRDPRDRADAPTLTVVRTIGAPPDRVFEAWTDPALLRRWLAPGRLEVVEAAADPRVGGGYRVVVVDPMGNHHVTTGEYRELVPGRRLVKTWVYEGPSHPAGRYPTLLTVDFRDAGAGTTELTIRQDRLLTEMDREGNREGWRLCLDKLEALLAADRE